MIEFTLNRNRNGKKSRWAKRYPRKRILKRGSEKAAGWYFHNWYDDSYHYFHGDLHKFLLKNVGRPVDKVFSEFLQRCRRGTEKYNLREWFYDMFEEKENIDYRGGFYLSNGIINYKKPTKRPKSKPYILIEDRNRVSMPVLAPICRECDATHTKQFLGIFWLSYGTQKRVYLVEKNVYDTDLNLQVKYKPCYIHGVGRGIREVFWCISDKPRYEIYGGWYGEHLFLKYIFITKK